MRNFADQFLYLELIEISDKFLYLQFFSKSLSKFRDNFSLNLSKQISFSEFPFEMLYCFLKFLYQKYIYAKNPLIAVS